LKVLACDDDASVGQMLRAALEPDGWVVEFTTLGTECIALLPAAAPDVVILDRVMPGLGGMEVAQRIRADGYRGPILLFSAFIGPDLETDARALKVIPVPKADVEGLMGRLEKLRANLSG
jgi:CheY-like chemotaxis protein